MIRHPDVDVNVFDKREQSQTCLSFAERRKGRTKFNINAVLINDGMPQDERLVKLNNAVILLVPDLVDVLQQPE